VEGGALRELKVGKFNVLGPTWSADGSSILFTDAVTAGISTIRSVDLKTMTATVVPDSSNLIGPGISPDGKYIVAASLAGDRLLLFNIATQRWSELTKKAAIGWFQWSPDSKFVYFDNGFNANQAVFRVHVSDHKVEQVADLKDFRRVVIPWHTWFGLTPDGNILLMHDIGTQEVYALDFEVP